MNTGITFILYWLLLLIIDYRVAYATSFVTGITLSYLINLRFVFRTRGSRRKMLLYPLVYLATYGVGAVILQISVSRFAVPAALAPFISICATLPMTYLLSKFILRDRDSHSS